MTWFRTFLALWALWAALVIALGRITLPRLRANPETRERLGLEWTPRWDIFNVAMSLSWPAVLIRPIDRYAEPDVHAHSELLRAHTRRIDRVLARACYAAQLLCVLSFLGWVLTRA